ncbi:hypothetical protein K0T92_13490 [Paenibacillus oenotherae]|uniref:Uncharacterized protein n=1 Tax=Paenibacillus oenotherae TaxID=1435645 RepID=A0ABS7D747_9BACL|nr:hypothetical protein [Paenibacillus oenotherae]MBW7475762.1 hypothetical protein [Paenibacillus oenotherae]
MITCVMYAFIYLIDTIGLEKNEIMGLAVNTNYFQISIYIIGLSYCIWKDWRGIAVRNQN